MERSQLQALLRNGRQGVRAHVFL